MNKQKISKKVKIIGLIIIIIGSGVGIFFLGRKISKNANSSKTNEQKTNQEKEIENIQTKLQQTQDKLAAETNSDEKQKLQTEIDQLEQQLTNLKSGNNPINPPINKTHRQLTVKYNTKVGDKHEYININDYQERILIDAKNQIFSSAGNLCVKDNQYNFSFYEEDADKKPAGFIFDENNNKFQLTFTTPSPSPIPPKNPNSNQIEIEVKWGGGSNKRNYWLLTSADWPKTRKEVFISKKHSSVKGKKFAHQITPKLKITFEEKDVSQKINDDRWLFGENNNKFTLTPLANWPDDPNYQNEIEKETPPTIKEARFGGFGVDYFIFSNFLGNSISSSSLEHYYVHKDHPEAKRLASILKNENSNSGDRKIWNISFTNVNKFENMNWYFEKHNDELEIKEKV